MLLSPTARRDLFLWAVFVLGLVSASATLGAQTTAHPPNQPQTNLGDCSSLLAHSAQAIHSESFADATQSAQRARYVCSDPEPALLDEARAQMLSHQFDASATSLQTLLALDPKNIEALILKGQLSYLTNHDAEAALALQQAIDAAPTNAEPHYWLGKLRFEDKQPQQAVKEFQTALACDATFYRAYDGLGLSYAALGENGHAVQSFTQAIELTHSAHPDYDTAYADLAELLLKLGKNQQAFDLAAEAATRNPLTPRNFYLAGKASQQAGQYAASIRWLNKAAEADPAYPDPHYILAQVYRRMGNTDAATAEAAKFQTLSVAAPKVRR